MRSSGTVTAIDVTRETESVSKVEHLLRAADRGLYVSKSLGGNRASAAAITPYEADTRTGAKNESH